MRWTALLGLSVVVCACATSEVLPDEDAGDPGKPDAGKTCLASQKLCGATCVDVTKDPANCGNCNVKCTQGQFCSSGKCTNACTMPNTLCGQFCIDISTDHDNCGKCGMGCAVDQICVNKTCVKNCAQGLAACDMDCVDFKSDPNHCGDCNTACGMNQICTGSICCNFGQVACNGQCVDTSIDPNNCGACAFTCGGNTPGCSNGVCGPNVDHGPMHTFTNLTTDHYITQGCCSVNCQNNDAVDADYFCKHFYGQGCMVLPGWKKHTTPNATYPKMHKNGGCTSNGNNIPNTTCDQGPCKIGNWSEITSGLNNLICRCP